MGRDPRQPGLLAGVAVLVVAASSAGCFDRGYPLGVGGDVAIRPDVEGDLFAADALDAAGKALEPRQKPYKTGVTLALSEDNEAANGAFVEVRVEPPEALTLVAAEDEDSAEPTCKLRDGTFRCTATAEGIAQFTAQSDGDWSGKASLVVIWAGQRRDQPITILPAGLPKTSVSFALVANGLTDSDRVLPTYTALSCTTIDTLPGDLGSKWRPGKIRSRPAVVRASAPAAEPGVVANAPVIIESLSSEAALSLDAACDETSRKSRLRVVLDATGESPPFHLCFSDIGGDKVEFLVKSGQLTMQDNPTLRVEPEPRVLRVSATTQTIVEGTLVELFEVTAFDTDLQPIAMSVDLESSDPAVLKLATSSTVLSADGANPTGVTVAPLAAGTATLHVRPRLFKNPDCESFEITVTAAP
jgi:hypothetical protein